MNKENQPQRYAIKKTLVLGFIQAEGHGEQFDAIIEPDDWPFLETDGQTIWVVSADGGRQESTTIAGAVDDFQNRGLIEKE